ncbi:MAG TPA: glucose 1-dehydrogenase [Geobacteraceae bacterium]|nr:glucose 1-dehydrogenase [Geobacteraceae bacterium]
MANRLNGKVALISGASGGLGAAQARMMAAEGAKVFLGDLEPEGSELRVPLKTLCEEITAKGGDADYQKLDVTRENSWAQFVSAAEERFGKVNVLSNNAGIYLHKTLTEHTFEDFQRIVGVNQLGVLLGMKTAVPPMERAGGGSIINFASIYGIAGAGISTAYQGTKGAVRLMTKSAALELVEKNIRVNAICPGMFDTNLFETSVPKDAWEPLISLVPMKRFGRPDEIAYGVIFLASDESSFMTGSDLVIDGGYTCP